MCDALSSEACRQGITGHYTTLSFAHSGVYMLEVWDGAECVTTERLIVQ